MEEEEQTAQDSAVGGGTAPSTAERDCSVDSSMSAFPNHFLERILQFVKSRRDRNSASLVCKSWYRAEAFTRHDLYVSNCYSISPRRAISRFQRVRFLRLKGKPPCPSFVLPPPAYFEPWVNAMTISFAKLEKIYLSKMTLINRDLARVARSYPRFKELTLFSCDGYGTGGLAKVVGQCRQLRVLDLIDGDVRDDKVDWISCFPEGGTCLESLMFQSLQCTINFEALERLVTRSPLLKTLKLNPFVSIEQLQQLVLRAPQLTHLGTGAFCYSSHPKEGNEGPELTSLFAASGSLTILSVFNRIIPGNLPAIISICAMLSILDFSKAVINGEELSSVIRHCHMLQALRVHDLVCDEGLLAVADTCKDLRELQVCHGRARAELDGVVSEVGLLAISEGCRQLQSITYECHRMTNAALIAMSENCPELVKFRVSIEEFRKPDTVTREPLDEGFGAIVRNCKKLTKLGVSGLLTDKAFSYIENYGKLVETLTIYLTGENDMELTHVFEGCPRLKKLEISWHRSRDLGLLFGLHRYSNMRSVWLHICRPSVGICKEIARKIPHLVVESCSYMNEEEDDSDVVVLYLYPSLEGPRTDAPSQIKLL